MRALVTGGHGFIGSHLCAHLVAEGHEVRVLARPGSDLGALAALPVRVYPGDLRHPLALAEALAGIHWVFHLAGALAGLRESDLMAVNRDGTLRLLEACRTWGGDLRRFLLVSSLAAAGPSPGGPVPRPDDAEPRPLTWYGRSKLAAEAAVRASGLPFALLRPPVVFGAGDRATLPLFRLARRGLVAVPGGPPRWYSLISAPDLAEGLLRAAESPAAEGEILPLLHPEPLSGEALGHLLARAFGRPGRTLRVPPPLLALAGRSADVLSHLQGRPRIFSRQKVAEMLAPAWVASPAKAQRILGWTAPTPHDRAIALALQGYRRHGWL